MADVPDPRRLALTLRALGRYRLPWKATAGLHHPFSHHDATLGTHMYGFINVFTAGIMALHRDPDHTSVERVLRDTEAAAFVLTSEGLSWRDHHFSALEIAVARATFALGFGSCSFEEPRDELRTAGFFRATHSERT